VSECNNNITYLSHNCNGCGGGICTLSSC